MFQTFCLKFGTYFKNCRKNSDFRTLLISEYVGMGSRRGCSAYLLRTG